jgi:hypothetical protein
MSNRSRRRGVVFSAAAVVAAAVLASVVPARAADQRSYATRNAMLQLDNEQHIVRAAQGGYITADVVTERGPGATGVFPKKHLAGAKVEPIEAVVNGDDFAKFIQQQLENPSRVNGSLGQADSQGKSSDQIDFQNAMLTELDLPAFDAASKDPFTMGMTLQADSATRHKSGSNDAPKYSDPHKKKALVANFRVDISGVNNTSRISKVEAITLKRQVTSNPVGESRDYQKTPATWDVSNIALHVGAQDIADFVNWHDDFVVKGNSGDDKERTLTLTLLDPSMKSPMLTFQASNVGIISVAPEDTIEEGQATGNKESIRRYRVELYAERMTLNPGAGGASANAAAGSNGSGDSPSATGSPASGDTSTATPAQTETPVARTKVPVSSTQPRLRRPRQ